MKCLKCGRELQDAACESCGFDYRENQVITLMSIYPFESFLKRQARSRQSFTPLEEEPVSQPPSSVAEQTKGLRQQKYQLRLESAQREKKRLLEMLGKSADDVKLPELKKPHLWKRREVILLKCTTEDYYKIMKVYKNERLRERLYGNLSPEQVRLLEMQTDQEARIQLLNIYQPDWKQICLQEDIWEQEIRIRRLQKLLEEFNSGD